MGHCADLPACAGDEESMKPRRVETNLLDCVDVSVYFVPGQVIKDLGPSTPPSSHAAAHAALTVPLSCVNKQPPNSLSMRQDGVLSRVPAATPEANAACPDALLLRPEP